MRRFICAASVVFMAVSLFYGCNIVPRSVQYQREEEKLVGGTDAINPVVEEIQVALSQMGYDTGAKDGRMGQETREAIKKFQESIGLKATGYLNKLTFRQIEDIRRANDERELQKSYKIEVRSVYSKEEKASSSELIATMAQIQTALKNAGFNPGAIDGKLGSRTKQAIKEFQKTKGLKVDGVVGPKTWAELGKYLDK